MIVEPDFQNIGNNYCGPVSLSTSELQNITGMAEH